MKFRDRLSIKSILVLLLVVFSLVACTSNESDADDKPLIDESLTLSTTNSEIAVKTDNRAQTATTNLDSFTLFSQNCAACHGATGAGTTIAPPLNSAELRARMDDNALRDTISNGRPGTAMPVWSNTLSAEQIDDLVDLIRRWPELNDDDLAELQEEATNLNIGPNMMQPGMMGSGMMNSHMGWQRMAPNTTPNSGQNSGWGHHGMNNSNWQSADCCGQGMMRPGN